MQRGVPTIVAQSSHSIANNKTHGNSDLRLFMDGTVWSFNDNAKRGFEGGIATTSKFTCDDGFVVKPPGVPVLENQWIAQNYVSRVSDGLSNSEKVVLCSSKTTTLLRIKPVSVPLGLSLDARTSSVFAAVYSAATLLRKAVAAEEEIDTGEIEICKIRNIPLGQNPLNEFVGEISFSDKLINGSGFVNRVFDRWNDLIKGILSPQPGSFSDTIISKDHICDSACYECLKEYNNMIYHGLLDWKLGMAFLRVLGDPSYTCGLDGNFNTPEMSNWLKVAEKAANTFAEYFGCKPCHYGRLPGFELNARPVIVVYPLWRTDNHIWGLLADAVAEAGGQAKFVNSFNLIRAPGTTYRNIGASP